MEIGKEIAIIQSETFPNSRCVKSEVPNLALLRVVGPVGDGT